MRFADFLVDLAAVANASRHVAARHAALRTRQLDRYGKTSSLVASLQPRPTPVPPASPAQSPRTPARSQGQGGQSTSTTAVRDSSSQVTGESSLSDLRKGEPARVHTAPVSHIPSIAHARSADIIGDAGGLHNPAAVLRRLREQAGPAVAARSDGRTRVETAIRAEEARQEDTPPARDSGGDDAPPGVNVNVFRLALGSAGAEGQQSRAGRARAHPAQSLRVPEFVDHGHGKAAASPPRGQQQDRVGPSLEAVADSSPTTPESELVGEIPTSQLASQPRQQGLLSADASANLTSVSAKGSVSELAAEPRSRYELRESKVPASRFSRLWNYGGLAAGMLGGAITESISRAAGGGSGQGSVLLSGKNMERLVAKLSRMRGAALKLGQMMSFQDAKVLPAPLQEVLQRVQDRADYMPAWQRDRVLVANLGSDWRGLFEEFEETPIAAASIGQVHRATLKASGQRVAVKIQFPGVADSINSDLDNLGILLAATSLLPKGLYLNKTIDNARTELGWECDYEREARCAARYRELLTEEEDTFVVPRIHPAASGKQVLTMDFMDGVGVTRVTSFTQEQRDWIGTQILRLCLREITEFRFMQTDPNWTNFLYNAATNQLELLDFGASREFPVEFVTQYVQLLEAASRADRDAIKRLSESLGYLTGHESKAMLDAHVASVSTLAEPFLASAPEVYDFQDQTITERVKALIPLMLRERLAPPPEETYSLHRKLSGAFLLCARLGSRVRCRDLFQTALEKSPLMNQPT